MLHSAAAPGDARRRFRPVVKLGWPIEFSFTGEDARVHRATTAGIGVGGTFIQTDVPLEVGTRLRLWLHRPVEFGPAGPEILPLHGEVRWISPTAAENRPRGAGVAFRALTARDEVTLHGYFSAALKMI